MARPFDKYDPTDAYRWVDSLNAASNVSPRHNWEQDAAFQTQDVNVRNFTYRIREVIDEEQMARIGHIDAEKMLKARMAKAIGDVIIQRACEFTRSQDPYRRQMIFTAEFIAIPPDQMRGDTLHVAQQSRMQPPPVVQERIVEKRIEIKVLPVEYATDALVEVWQIAYDMAMSNPDDDVAPEKRALDAVLDYMKEKITPV